METQNNIEVRKNTKSNLPCKNEINLFTTVKNINQEQINQIVETIRKAKKVKLVNAEDFDFYIFKDYYDLSFDTIMYLVEYYEFSKPETQMISYKNELYIRSCLNIGYAKITVNSEKWQINLLPNDVKEVVYQ